MTMTNEAQVTDDDRALLKSILELHPESEMAWRIDQGLAYTVEAEEIAAHRIAAEKRRDERIARIEAVLRKIMPIRVNDGPDYASVYFGDSLTHSTQAMTMNPEDWRELSDAFAGGEHVR